jgi:hypothetical protein
VSTDALSTDDFGAEQQTMLDAIADVIEAAHRLPGARMNGSVDRQILEAAHEAYETLATVIVDDMVGARAIEPLPAIEEEAF